MQDASSSSSSLSSSSPSPSDRIATLKLQLLGAAVVLVAVLFFGPGPFVRPELWAEDGAAFLAGPLVDGVWSCFRPVGSVFLLLSRVVAFIAVQLLPLWLVPAVFAWVPLLTAAFVLSALVRDDMSWVHPDRRWRFAVVVALAMVPALTEVTMALCNGTYVLGLATYLFCLRDRPRFNAKTVSLMVVLMLSSTITLVVPAIWAWRALFEKAERTTHLKLLAASVVPFVVIATSALLQPFAGDDGVVYSAGPPAFGIAPFDIVQLVEIFASRLGILVVGLPVLGGYLTRAIMLGDASFWGLPVLALVVLAAFWRVHHRIVLGVLLGVSLFPLMQLGRNYGGYLALEAGNIFAIDRWSLVAEVFCVIGFMGLAARARASLRWLIVVPLLQNLVITLEPRHISNDWEWYPKPFAPVAEIIEQQRHAIAIGEATELLTPDIPVHPHRWATFQIRLRRSSSSSSSSPSSP